jgi:N-6 DNA Methylase
MSSLASDLRRQLENIIIQAREVAEDGARSALQKRGVHEAKPYPHFSTAERKLRQRLRARGKQAGDIRQENDTQTIDQLTQELAYEFWHRMLFARFLAENHLLINPDGVPVSLDECEELAESENAANGFVLAARYASKMLPEIFRTDDVLLEIDFAPEHRIALEKELSKLPSETFLADDSLGWVYQFWQSKKKDEVNKSGNKIDSRTISSVTQLFTEDYMVKFLLHNTLGAWWCAKEGISGQGAGVKPGDCPVTLEYLRWRDDRTPAAGKFEGWPKTLKEFRLLDPCCGSGHFLVAAFNLLAPLRMHDEGLSAVEACDAVLRENLFGLELDPRCAQIAAFALAFAAWKFCSPLAPREESRVATHLGLNTAAPIDHKPNGDSANLSRSERATSGESLGYRELPSLNIACTGIGPQASEEEWLKLAEQSGHRMNALSRDPILNGLRNLHGLFSDAPTLGSLIDPNQLSSTLISADYETLLPFLSAALKAEQADDDAHERAVAAAGMVKAAELLAGEYTLVITNVPYLGRGKQDDVLMKHLEQRYPHSKADLATTFIERCLEFCASSGTTALVTPQNWLFLTSYKTLRESLLKKTSWNLVSRLGTGAFDTIGGQVVNVALLALSASRPFDDLMVAVADVSGEKTSNAKAATLQTKKPILIHQKGQLENPDSRIMLGENSGGPLLSQIADSLHGQGCFDSPCFVFAYWELPRIAHGWVPQQNSPTGNGHFSGCSSVLRWEYGKGRLADLMALKAEAGYTTGKWRAGIQVWGKTGVAVSLMNNLESSIYLGVSFADNVTAIVPSDEDHVLPILALCKSPEFLSGVRDLDQKLCVTCNTFSKIPFDLEYWKNIAAQRFPNGMPEPESDDPTQWLFHGRPESSAHPLQAALSRILGYRWPAELDQEMRLSKRARNLVESCKDLLPFADADGIVAIPPVRNETAAAERLLELLQISYGLKWSNPELHRLLTEVRCPPGTTLDDWLRNAFFEQHCKLFHNRPFIWHIWDGRKDGFSVLVNYHKFDHKGLENLTYSYLQDWITAQAAAAKSGKTGADLRLAAAQTLQDKLKLILEGEPPYDIFVRWKPLSEQAIGWHPDLNDGVRMNIRPFMQAGVLRKNPNIKWTKDRGKEPQRDKTEYPWFWNGDTFTGDRVNDIHLTNQEKQAARDRKAGGKL